MVCSLGYLLWRPGRLCVPGKSLTCSAVCPEAASCLASTRLPNKPVENTPVGYCDLFDCLITAQSGSHLSTASSLPTQRAPHRHLLAHSLGNVLVCHFLTHGDLNVCSMLRDPTQTPTALPLPKSLKPQEKKGYRQPGLNTNKRVTVSTLKLGKNPSHVSVRDSLETREVGSCQGGKGEKLKVFVNFPSGSRWLGQK